MCMYGFFVYVIKQHPMDISTMEKKVRGKEYNTRADFIADFRLIAKNCHKYNGPDNGMWY